MSSDVFNENHSAGFFRFLFHCHSFHVSIQWHLIIMQHRFLSLSYLFSCFKQCHESVFHFFLFSFCEKRECRREKETYLISLIEHIEKTLERQQEWKCKWKGSTFCWYGNFLKNSHTLDCRNDDFTCLKEF